MDRVNPSPAAGHSNAAARAVSGKVTALIGIATEAGDKGRQTYGVSVNGREIKAQGRQGFKPGDPVLVLKQNDGSFVLKPSAATVSTAGSGTPLSAVAEAARRVSANLKPGNPQSSEAVSRSLPGQKNVAPQNASAAPSTISPARLATEFLTQAFGAANLSLSTTVIARLSAEFQTYATMLGAQERRDLVRIAAAQRELERKGIRLDPERHSPQLGFLAGLRDRSGHEGGTGFGTGFNEEHSDNKNSRSGTTATVPEPGPEELQTVLDLFNNISTGETVWAVYPLASDCVVRLCYRNDVQAESREAPGQEHDAKEPLPSIVNVEIEGPDGPWSFHWNETERSVLRFSAPSGTHFEEKSDLASELAGLGFKRLEIMDGKSWYDGFYFSQRLFIIKSVDVLG